MKTKMTLKEAITSIGEKNALLGTLAREALELNDFKPFVKYVKKLFNDGAAHLLATNYTHEVIDTIIKSK